MKSFKERLEAQRAEKGNLRKRVLPLSAFYGREPDFERRRLQFYTDMEKALRAEVQTSKKKVRSVTPSGRDGRPAEIASIGRGRSMPVITNTAPLEFLFSKGLLQGKRDAHGAAYVRLSAGLRLRGILEGAEISGLKAANLEGSSGGGAPGKLPGEYKMDCIYWLSRLRGPEAAGGMPRELFAVLEDVVYHDRWIWEKVRSDRQESVLLKIQKALDMLAVRLHLMQWTNFSARWRASKTPAGETGSPDPSPDQHQPPAEIPSQP